MGGTARCADAGDVYDRHVPTLLRTLLHPQRTPPPPIDVDLARVMGVGTSVWGLALVVTGVLWSLGVVPGAWVWVAAAGIALGLIGVVWARRNGRLAPDGTGAMIRPAEDQASARPEPSTDDTGPTTR